MEQGYCFLRPIFKGTFNPGAHIGIVLARIIFDFEWYGPGGLELLSLQKAYFSGSYLSLSLYYE
jgi:hypothetical protein